MKSRGKWTGQTHAIRSSIAHHRIPPRSGHGPSHQSHRVTVFTIWPRDLTWSQRDSPGDMCGKALLPPAQRSCPGGDVEAEAARPRPAQPAHQLSRQRVQSSQRRPAGRAELLPFGAAVGRHRTPDPRSGGPGGGQLGDRRRRGPRRRSPGTHRERARPPRGIDNLPGVVQVRRIQALERPRGAAAGHRTRSSGARPHRDGTGRRRGSESIVFSVRPWISGMPNGTESTLIPPASVQDPPGVRIRPRHLTLGRHTVLHRSASHSRAGTRERSR